MRQLLFFLGLAFATTVLIANVDAIWCYRALMERPHKKVDCDQETFPHGRVTNGQCFKHDGTLGKEWGCAFSDKAGISLCIYDGYHCCNDVDFCNGDATSTPLEGALAQALPEGDVTTATADHTDAPEATNANHTDASEATKATTSGAMTSTPRVPLLIAVVGSAIAVLGI